eukprot:scaffold4111_cov132-Isochrysis_galbana.AAC.4
MYTGLAPSPSKGTIISSPVSSASRGGIGEQWGWILGDLVVRNRRPTYHGAGGGERGPGACRHVSREPSAWLGAWAHPSMPMQSTSDVPNAGRRLVCSPTHNRTVASEANPT